MSIAVRFAERQGVVPPLLSAYVDDIYGGNPHNVSYDLARDLRSYICSMGSKLTFIFNDKPHKTPLPSRQQVILGCLFDSTNRRMRSADAKVAKYVGRINELLPRGNASAPDIMSLHGNLSFAANVAPFGRPFLAALSALVIRRKKADVVTLGNLARLCLRVWNKMLATNRGLSYDFILGTLPRAKSDIFVDASGEWGIGGCYDNYYFCYSWRRLSQFAGEFIARKELLAALVALLSFGPQIQGKLVTLYTDNTAVAKWLTAGRSSSLRGLKYLALWELKKCKLQCKVSPRWLPSTHNISADKLSRNKTPNWLVRDGVRVRCDLDELTRSRAHVEES